ncbi:PAS domain S-box-containing protein/diguanylate cyclase (GGDEF) domain-containing protein [Quadrisphaera granulorum]|uniref:PAS domain S-box-containing protein/diguanylate cyclase (GGDEF)-like protein n=2 Tax=Quadrisphaera granulorum TaxID=317664 RepID=A0A316A758_9ACTN|nr:PAS domain S-box-containing protein/diguanylate cyclase (GGDEF)-like protein [Quadrisphaera granulorum]SZE96755.1 PAS domain S-box-containing protein/diguanylate cyclase (GGDEF) domain-containing protein [Quadrisphaera granulorum]
MTLGTPLADEVITVGCPVVVLIGVVAALWRARQHTGRQRWVWALLAVGVLAWCLNSVMIDWQGWTGELVRRGGASALSISLTAVCTLAGTVAFGLLLTIANTPGGVVRDALDSALITAAACGLTWYALFGAPEDVAAATGGRLTSMVGVVIVAELFAVAVTVHTALRMRRRHPGLGMVCLGVVSLVAGDAGSAALVIHDPSASSDAIAWSSVLASVLLLAGAASGRAATTKDDDGRSLLSSGALPCFAALLALATSLPAALAGRAGPVDAWLHLMVLVLLLVRALLLARDGDLLMRGLEQRVAARTRDLASTERRFASLVIHGSDVMTVVGADGVITYVSPAALRVFGIDPCHLVGKSMDALVTSEGDRTLLDAVVSALGAPGSRRRFRMTAPHATGRQVVLDVCVTGLTDDPAIAGVVINSHDVSEAVRLEEELSHQAFSDALTGLPNRALFRDRVEHALRSRGTRGPVEVCYLDLDGFKEVNDTLGHGAGDELLVAVAERLRATVREGDTVARLGGDEFAVLLDEATGEREPERLAQRLCDAVRRPFIVRGVEVNVATSVGLASTDTTGRDVQRLLRSADLAMYQAKSQRQGGYATYHPRMHEQLLERVRLETDLRRAVEQHQFRVVYQPLVDMGTGGVNGVEALVRWHHPERGVISPVTFIPLAESTGLIGAIGEYVLREACRQVAAWRSEVPGAENMRVSVNLSAPQLDDPDLVGLVTRTLEETGLPATSLVLEVTEGVLVDQHEAALTTLNALRGLGIRLAIDDFGTGYSSLSYLHRLPVDILKIDKSFVDRLSDNGDLSLVDAILSMATTLGLATVAEGIEHEHQRSALAAQGCDIGQGYHFSPPVEAADMPGVITAALHTASSRGAGHLEHVGDVEHVEQEVAR